jgi:tight adherence protein C
MVDFLIEKLSDTRFLAMLFAAVAAIATVVTLAMPLIVTDALGKRMKAVAIEREKIRQRERERLARGDKVSLRRSPKQYMQRAVDRFNPTNGSARRRRAHSWSRPATAARHLTSPFCSSVW